MNDFGDTADNTSGVKGTRQRGLAHSRHAAGPMSPCIADILAGARQARSDPVTSEAAIRKALSQAPEDRDAHLAAYKFYFYNHRLAEALPHAAFLLAHSARHLNIPADWRDVKPEDASFAEAEAAPGLYLQALIAWGYCKVRTGALGEGSEALAKACALDPRDRFGARRVLAVIAAATSGEDG